MKNKLLKYISFLLVFLLSSCNTTETSISNSGSTSNPSTPSNPIVKVLDTPILNINNDNGLVSWESVKNATYYSYYINNEEIKTISTTSLQLNNGDVLSIMANSSSNEFISSAWSKPVTYFDPNIKSQYVNIYFHDTSLSTVSILKGSTYSVPAPTKLYHQFKGWYLDPYFKEELKDNHTFNKNTVLYPNFVKDEWINNTTYWLKASPHISSSVISSISSSTGWKFIPLSYDATLSTQYSANVFSVSVNVNDVTNLNNAAYIIMDGTYDSDGRTYFKDIDTSTGDQCDFTINENGTYKIIFSVISLWNKGTYKVQSTYTKISSSLSSIYDNSYYPKHLLDNNELPSPNLLLDKDSGLVSWDIIDHASKYEYIINNGNIKETTSNNINLPLGSEISVRAIGEGDYLSSRWSTPICNGYELNTYDHIYVYFYGTNNPSIMLDKGAKATRPNVNPVKPNYIFDDYYTDITYKTKFDFNKELYENTLIYARFIYDNAVKYQLFNSSKNTKIGDFVISEQYEYNEYKITYNASGDLTYYVKEVATSKFYGPYIMEKEGTYNMYFSVDHKWDINTNNERNAYWAPDVATYYFSNNMWWDKVYVYMWGDDGYKKSWPGETMTFYKTNDYGESIYKVEVESKYHSLIFNNNNKQTIDITLSSYPSGTGFYCTGSNSPYNVGTWMEG